MKRRALRAITGLLYAALFFSNMACIRAFAIEEGGQEMQIQEYNPKDDTWEEEDEKAEETEQAGSDAEPEIGAGEGNTDSDDENQEEKEKEESDEEVETGSEGNAENPEEGAEETAPGDSLEELLEGEAVETVSENTVEEELDAEDIPVRVSFFPQVYSSGKSFMVDGKTYNSIDADESYAAGDDITAYYFEADRLLYFDGTEPMEDWSTPVTRPWNNIKPAVCVIGEGITTVGASAFYWPTHTIPQWADLC